ncbi:uncharacterized protein LOC121381768 [Gigantopelta aegis]|uniref:uncharacterized protein LOC121381768 n=1 Tax=Gigantopelta aegis TaxID=1735272 RepID=UPI001B88812E|nr:uncharacterized protein LOC121381768 [Gigantopelta aegis]
MGDFNGHHTLWGCEDVNTRGKQLDDLIIFNDKSRTYFHAANGSFTSIDLTLCSPSLFLDLSWKVGPDPCGSDHFPIFLENDGPPSLERVQRWKLWRADWDQFQHLCSTRLQQSAIDDADYLMSSFTSILKEIAEETIPKTSAVPKHFTKPWFNESCKDDIKERNRHIERFKREPTWDNLSAYRIAKAKARREIRQIMLASEAEKADCAAKSALTLPRTNAGIPYSDLKHHRFGGCEEENAVQEWGDFKQYMSDHMHSKTASDVVRDLVANKGLKLVYPIMAFLAEIYMVLPPHAAD